ncbi:hypothetical protein GLYMA_07G119051v4 [Glycine max]|nr:hypothetical protein GLYMA_07G119051v4 [Glycine max]KAH1086478.1 hypothetical protein GYH30_018139 [Glycine max]
MLLRFLFIPRMLCMYADNVFCITKENKVFGI